MNNIVSSIQKIIVSNNKTNTSCILCCNRVENIGTKKMFFLSFLICFFFVFLLCINNFAIAVEDNSNDEFMSMDDLDTYESSDYSFSLEDLDKSFSTSSNGSNGSNEYEDQQAVEEEKKRQELEKIDNDIKEKLANDISIIAANKCSVVNSEEREINGITYQFYKKFKIVNISIESIDDIPNDCIGMFGTNIVVLDENTPKKTIAFVKQKGKLVGGVLLKSFDYKCNIYNPLCKPLGDFSIYIEHVDPTSGYYRAEVEDLDTWFDVFDVLNKSKQIEIFAPLIDNGFGIRN